MIRLVLADDHAVVRAGLRSILEENGELKVVAEAATGDEVLRVLPSLPVDVLVLDVSMPGPGIFELLRRLKEEHPTVRVVVLTMHPEDQYGVRVLRAGASACLSKERSPELLVEAIRKAHSGGIYLTPSLGDVLASRLAFPGGSPTHAQLSDRELEVLVRLASGGTTKAIAADLGLSRKTVSTYHSRIRRKLGLQSEADLIRYALEQHLTT
jgi:two-component system, NarL family, invasion response regulator UvrY